MVSMDGRRAIFEHFVTNRRDDLKAEKKAKLKEAKKAFSALLREQVALQLSDGVWEAKTNLSVFLSTLEDAMDAQRYKIIQENAMALLPTSIQEKLFEAVVSEFKEQAEKVKAEESELLRHLQQQLTTSGGDATASLRGAGWESAQLQQVVTAFYASKATKTLLSKEQQRKVYRRANEALAPKSDSKYGGGGSSGEYRSTRDAQDERPSRYAPQQGPSPRIEEPKSSQSGRARSRSRSSHDARRRSRSRGRSREKDASRRGSDHRDSRSRDDHRSLSRRSRSSSHSRRRRGSSSHGHHRHRRSSSRSRSTRR